MYTVRLVFAFVLMEFLLHTVYVTAISKAGAFSGLSPGELIMIGYFDLNLVWLKVDFRIIFQLLIIWRFSRLWAMMDNIEVVENMQKCMSNNYSIQEFWKGWHCSFNRWIVRYLYIPLGGKKWAYLNIWIVFTFVAIWHDTKMNLLSWGWIIAAFFVPELALKYFTYPLRNKRYYRHITSFIGTLNIAILCIAKIGRAHV